LLDTYLIWKSVEVVYNEWESMNRIIQFMVGEPDSMNLHMLTKLMEEADVQSIEDLFDNETQRHVVEIMNEKGYGVQRICSHFLASHPMDPKPAQMPKSFTFMGQRFTVDSHVFSNVVYDRILVNGKKVERLLPDPLDAMFVLGNNRALHHLENEITTWQYQGTLHILRYLLDQYDSEFWTSNLYNGWLDTLRILSGPFEDPGLPKSVRTPAYRDKLLHTQLASWAELRHDTILYVKQSYTAYIICEYPDGYVEPVPDFYRKIKEFSRRACDIFSDCDLEIPDYCKRSYSSHFLEFANTMQQLETIAQKQLEGLPRTAEETQFIKNTIIEHKTMSGCTYITNHEGWYPRLFYRDTEDCVLPDFIVADVHTDFNEEQILHVGVGKIHVIYFTAETCTGPTIYVGPVFSYYEKVEHNMHRLNDEEWADLVWCNALTSPSWTNTFLLNDNQPLFFQH
jgi:hypothetical protein